MSDATPASNDFVPLVTTSNVRAGAIAELLRQNGFQVRAEPDASGDRVTVLIPRPDLSRARERGGSARSGVKWRHRSGGGVEPQCAKCGHGLKGLEGGRCPECASWFLLPSTEPIAIVPPPDEGMRTGEVIDAPIARARFIALMLREHWIDARLAADDNEPDGGGGGGRERRASVMVPRGSFTEARRAVDHALKHPVRWRLDNGRPFATCTTCDSPVGEPGAEGRCPVCHEWILFAARVPSASELRTQQRERANEGLRIFLAAAASLVGLGLLAAMVYKIIWH